jgi:hypothetical protein
MTARRWRETGQLLAARWAAHEAEYLAVGYAGPDDYRRRFVAQNWPNVGQHVKRHIRDGWRAEAVDA